MQPTRWKLVKRAIRHWWQRRTRGWDDSETWSLDATIARFIAPRIRRLREITVSHPISMPEETWNEVLEKMATAFEWYGSDESIGELEPEHVKEGFALFCTHYRDLWD